MGGKKGKIGGEEKRWGGGGGSKEGDEGGGGGGWADKRKRREAEGGKWVVRGGKVGQEGMGGGSGGGRTCICSMEYHHTEAPYSFTIQDHHTIKMQTFRDYHAILCQAIHIISHDNLVW